MKIKIYLLLLILLWPVLFIADDTINKARDVSDAAATLERLLDGLKQSENLDIETKEKVLALLTKFHERDVQLDIEAIIEDLEGESFDSAQDMSQDLLNFLIHLRNKISKAQSNEKELSVSLENILQEQESIRKGLENISENNSQPELEKIKNFKKKLMEFIKLSEQLSSQEKELSDLLLTETKEQFPKLKDYTGSSDFEEAKKRALKNLDRLNNQKEEVSLDQEKLSEEISNFSKSDEKSTNESLPKNKLSNEDRKTLENASDNLKENQVEKAVEQLNSVIKNMKERARSKMKREEKKTIEHLKEREKELAKRYQKFIDSETFPSEDSKNKMLAQVDQMVKIANEIKKGSLDSGIWESQKLESELKVLIKKLNFDLNRYSMDQNLVTMSDFIVFLEELRAKQLALHLRWSVSEQVKGFAKKTLSDQIEINNFSHQKDKSLDEVNSLSFLYGLRRIQKKLESFIDSLKGNTLPSIQNRKNLERNFKEIIDGLKSLKGSLMRENRPKKRESHSGEDAEMPTVSILEELKYLRLLQMHLDERRLRDPENSLWPKEQKEILDMMLQLRVRWQKFQKEDM